MPAHTRQCAFLTKMKGIKANTDKLATTLPDELKGIAESGVDIHASLNKFASDRPELYKAVLAKIAEADNPGIVATVPVARDPKSCKYTEEGTMIHDMMARTYKADRRMAALADLEVTLTAADKAEIAATIQEKGAEKGFDAAAIKEMIATGVPDKISVSKMV